MVRGDRGGASQRLLSLTKAPGDWSLVQSAFKGSPHLTIASGAPGLWAPLSPPVELKIKVPRGEATGPRAPCQVCLRRWEPARLPGPGRRAHKDRDVSSGFFRPRDRVHRSAPNSLGVAGGAAGPVEEPPTRAPAPAYPRHHLAYLVF